VMALLHPASRTEKVTGNAETFSLHN
jgi:hypothetical protein